VTRPGDPVVRNNGNDSLLCPSCGGDATHVEVVQVSARQEDGDFNEIFVHAITGEVRTQCPVPGTTAVSA